jgi:hypothetical protein
MGSRVLIKGKSIYPVMTPAYSHKTKVEVKKLKEQPV